MTADLSAGSRVRSGKRPGLPEDVAAYVRGLIVSGQVKPGQYLRMDPIAGALGVSNTPVREGLLQLQSEGFVEQVPRRGFMVTPFTRQDIRDIFWTQAQLAGELAARVAAVATPELIERLDRLVSDYERALRGDDEEAVARLGYEFHRQVNHTARSPRLAQLLSSVANSLSLRFYASVVHEASSSVTEHGAIVRAFEAGDVEKARTVMNDHVIQGADSLIKQLEMHHVWDYAEE